MKKQRIAIIGAGISGLGSAYFLHKDYDITLFEKNNYAGGHANTTTVSSKSGDLPIDTAVMIFNQANYPNFWRLIEKLDVPMHKISSTVSFQHMPSGLEFGAPNVGRLFAQWWRIFDPSFLRLLREIGRFGSKSAEVMADDRYATLTVSEYAKQQGFSEDFLYKYLLPLAAALWSADPKVIMDFPITTLVRYFANHNMLGPTAPKMFKVTEEENAWRGVIGGTRVYRDKLLALFPDALQLESPVTKVARVSGGAAVTTKDGKTQKFDRVIFACHADEALSLLADPTPLETELLSPFVYKTNAIALHTDNTVMPKNRRAWASFNSRIAPKDGAVHVTQNYWLNPLQNLPATKDYFLAIGSKEGVDPAQIMQRFTYSHPVYTVASAQAQPRLSELNQNGVTYFCGSYFKWAFHEDAFTSAIEVCKAITGKDPWGDERKI